MKPETGDCGFETDQTAYLQGELPEPRERDFESHLEGCATCASSLGELRSVLGLASTVEEIVPSPRFKREVFGLIERETGRVRMGLLLGLRTAGAYLLHRMRTSPRFRLAAISVGVHTVLLLTLSLIVFPGLVEERRGPFQANFETTPEEEDGSLTAADSSGNGPVPPAPSRLHYPEIVERQLFPPQKTPAWRAPSPRILTPPDDSAPLPLRPLFASALAESSKLSRLATQLGDGERAYRAIRSGLGYLAGGQAEDGSWSDRSGSYRVAVTATALLAFLSDGHSVTRGDPRWRGLVEKGVDWLLDEQIREGDLRGLFGPGTGHYNYNQALATLTLTEVWTLDRQRVPAVLRSRLRGAIRDAVRFILRCQTEKGGWRYTLEDAALGRADTSVTLFQMLALVSVKGARIDVPGLEDALARFDRWIHIVTGPDGVVGYEARGDRAADPRTLTAGTLFFEELLGLAPNQRSAQAALVRAELTDPGGETAKNGLLRFFSALAFRLRGEKILPIFGPALLTEQRADGSWNAAEDRHAVHGGDAFLTALNVLTLTSSYRWPA